MSYGGGSMMIMCCAVALLFRVQSETAEINASTDVPLPPAPWSESYHE